MNGSSHGAPERDPRRRRRRSAPLASPRRVGEVMTPDPETVEPDALADHCERLASGLGVHHLPVSEGGRLVGVICRCDLRHAGRGTVVADLMSSPPATIDPLVPLEEAAEAMSTLAVGCLPVMVGESLVGIVTRGDLMGAGLLAPLTRTCAACRARFVPSRPARSAVVVCADCIHSGRAFDLAGPDGEDST